MALCAAALAFAFAFAPLGPAGVQAAAGDVTSAQLSRDLLAPGDLPGFVVRADREVQLTEVLRGEGDYYDTLRSKGFQAAHERGFASYDEALFLEVRLIATRHHRAARPPQRGPRAQLSSPAPRDWVVSRGGGASYERRLYIATSRGALRVELLGTAIVDPLGDTRAAERRLERTVVAAARRQLSRVRPLPDVASRTIETRDEQRDLFAAVVSIVVALQLGFTLLAIVRDRGSRDRLTRLMRRRGDWAGEVTDVSASARRRLRRYRWALAGRVAVLVIVFALTFPLTMFKQALVLCAFGALVGALELAAARRGRTAGDRAPHGGRAVLAAAAGSLVSLVLSAGGIVLLVLAAVALRMQPPGVSEDQANAFALFCAIVAVIALGISSIPFRAARRVWLARTQELLDRDQRPELLLLRTWADDDLMMRVRRSRRQLLVERLALRRRDRFEELLAWSLWPLGPVVALGEPGRQRRPLGAAREYFGDDSWRAAVRARIELAAAIAIVPAPTENVVWELREIARQAALDKTVVVLPPVATPERRERERVLLDALGLDELLFERVPSGRFPLLVTFEHGRPRVTVADARDDVAYEAAVELAAAEAVRRSELRAGSVRRRRLLPPQVTPSAGEPRERRTSSGLRIVAGIVLVALLAHLAARIGHEQSQRPPVGTPVLENAPVTLVATSDDGRWYVAGNDERVHTVVEGSVRSAELDGDPTSLVTDGEMVYAAVGTTGTVHAFESTAEGLRERWSRRLGGPVTDLALWRGAVVAATPARGELIVLRTRDGARTASMHGARAPVALAAGAQRLYVADGERAQIEVFVRPGDRPVARIATASTPTGLTLAHGRLYAASVLGSTLEAFDARDLRRVYRVGVEELTGHLTPLGDLVVLGTQGQTRGVVARAAESGDAVGQVAEPEVPLGLAADGQTLLITIPMRGLLRLSRETVVSGG